MDAKKNEMSSSGSNEKVVKENCCQEENEKKRNDQRKSWGKEKKCPRIGSGTFCKKNIFSFLKFI